MAQGKGSAVSLRLGYESTYGVTPASPTTFEVPFAPTLDIKQTQKLNESKVIRGNRNPAKPFLGFKSVEGSVSVPVDTKAFGYWLKALFGAPTTTGTGPYTHTFKIGANIPSLFVEKAHTDLGLYYLTNGVKAQELSLEFGGDGELLANITLMGQKETVGTTQITTPTNATDGTPFGPFQISLTGATQVKSISLTFSNALDGDQYTIDNGAMRGSLPEGVASVSGSITALFMDDTLLDAARNQTEKSIVITLSDGTNSIVFDMGELILEPTGVAVDTPAGLVQTLNYRAYYNSDPDASALKVTLTNNVSSY